MIARLPQALPWAPLAALLLLTACSGSSALLLATPSPTREPTATALPTPTATPTPAPTAAPAAEATPEPTPQPTPTPLPRAEVVWRAPAESNLVALTFDTGVAAGHTAEILDILKEQGVKATFAITGLWAKTNPELLRRIVQEGHAIMNHSWDHASFTGESLGTPPLTRQERIDQLQRTEEMVQEVAAVSTKPYFRPPYGDFDPSVAEDAWRAGYRYLVMWGPDGMGWRGYSASRIVRQVLAELYPGAIILFHVGPGSREYAALERVIEAVRAAGLMPVTIPQLVGEEPIPTPTPVPTATPTPTPTATPTPRPTPSPTATPAPTLSPTPTPAPTATPAATPTP